MIGFFVKRPGVGVLLIVLVWAAGGVLAHQTNPKAPGKKAMALNKGSRSAPQQDSWRDKLDLDRARQRKEAMVQLLSDGTEVTFTLDAPLQKWTEDYLRRYELPYAGLVLLETKTGKVRVMAGHSEQNPRSDVEELCLRPWAPAASVFKLVTAAALLERGVPQNARVCYHGGLRGIDRHHIVDNPRLDSTCRTLSYAVAKSVNPIMAKLAVRHLDGELLGRWSKRFGFNRPLPFELPVEPSKATIPDSDLELARVAAGFWKTEISVLHGALIASVAANDGLLRAPTILQQVQQKDGRLLAPQLPAPQRVMRPASARLLGAMMEGTTTFGTARRSFVSPRGRPRLPGIKVAGKTGSLARKDPYLHYNWFVGFAPADKPEVAFAVLLGNPARWRIKAHTAAEALLERYLELKQERDKQLAEDKPAAAGKQG